MRSPRPAHNRSACHSFLLGLLLATSLPAATLAHSFSLTRLLPALIAQKPAAEVKEFWLGMYLGTQKIGYNSVRAVPTTYHGKPATQETSRGKTRMTLLGSTVEQDENIVTISDAQERPLEQIYDIKSNGSAIHVEARYDYAAHKVYCVIGSGAEASKKTLAIPPGANLTGDSTNITVGQKVTIGQKLTFYFLEPLSVELQQAQVLVSGQETVLDASTGKKKSAYIVKTALPLGQMTAWVTADGDMLKGEMSLGVISMRMVKESKEVALGEKAGLDSPEKATYTPPADFAVATAIAPDKPITNPRQLRRLQVTISGIPDKDRILSDARQQVDEVSGSDEKGYTVRMTIQANSFAAANAATLPLSDPALIPYTQKAPYLDTTDAAIRTTATTLRGNETNLYRIATAIRDWVHQHMTPDASIGVPRSATDIYARRRGVCRDYATLYTALARAAGVPTRLCSGIVYAEGRFYYHAWAESYVGEWVTFDPTLYDPKDKTDYVDATHIKFAQGDATDMFNVVSVIGKLHITVQDAGQ